jgi:DNA-binding NarL/FixJ family response regulator
LRGRRYLSSSVAPGLGESASDATALPNSLGRLTPRQRRVLQQVAEGHSAKQIAACLNISTKTVEYHKKGIMQALGLRSTADLVRYAVKHGLVSA